MRFTRGTRSGRSSSAAGVAARSPTQNTNGCSYGAKDKDAPAKPYSELLRPGLTRDLELWRMYRIAENPRSVKRLGAIMGMSEGQAKRAYQRASYFVKSGGDPELRVTGCGGWR